MRKVYVVGTMDTKGPELSFAAACARAAGAATVLVDVGTREDIGGADVSAREVASHHPAGADAVLGKSDRGTAVTAMAEALTVYLRGREDIGAVLGLGGTGNTALVTHAMRALPIGVPKLMVSTVASGNTAPYVGPNDLAMMYSVVDIAGLNAISRRVIGNAAHAAAGMALHEIGAAAEDKPGLGISMFGVTTAVADLLVGGVFAATEDRFGSVIRTGVPYVGSVGAVDMVNFGNRDSVPARFRDRKLHVHNSEVTLMRTTSDENRQIGEFIVSRLNQMNGQVRFLLPLKGVSAIDAPGQPFQDPDADEALFRAIRSGWQPAPNRQLVELDLHINDPAFAAALVDHFNAIA
jgi:uncharacterized protein (UPF0261 family)